MKKITVRELDKVIARLTINELILLKAIIKEWEYTWEYGYDPVYLETTNERLYEQTDYKIKDFDIIKTIKSLENKGIISKGNSKDEMKNKELLYIKINWDAVIEEAVLPDGYTGRIY